MAFLLFHTQLSVKVINVAANKQHFPFTKTCMTSVLHVQSTCDVKEGKSEELDPLGTFLLGKEKRRK